MISQAGLFGKPDVSNRDLSKLSPSSSCDNVVLEYAMALELKERELIKAIIPLFVDDVDISRAADVCVDAINAKVEAHLKREDLGKPLQAPHNVHDTIELVGKKRLPGCFDRLPPDLPAVAKALDNLLTTKYNRKPFFEVQIGFRAVCEDDEQVATELS